MKQAMFLRVGVLRGCSATRQFLRSSVAGRIPKIRTHARRGRVLAYITATALLLAGFTQAIAGPIPRGTATVDMQCAPFGSIIYSLGNALEQLLNQQKASVRIVNAEGAGSTATTFDLATDGTWARRIGCTSSLDYYTAAHGLPPFTAPVDLHKKVRVLFNYLYGAIGFFTLNPQIHTLRDLNGKRVALGNRGQAHWGGIPTLLAHLGLPGTHIRLEYLGTKGALSALTDGTVAASVAQVVVTPNGEKAYLPGVISRALATGKKIYFVGIRKETIRRVQRAGVPIRPIAISPRLVPGIASTEPVTWVFSPAMVTVSDNFPESLAYRIVHAVIRNAGALPRYNKMFSTIDTAKGLLGPWKAADLDVGAAKAFKQSGLLK